MILSSVFPSWPIRRKLLIHVSVGVELQAPPLKRNKVSTGLIKVHFPRLTAQLISGLDTHPVPAFKMHKWAQGRSDTTLLRAQRCIVVNREDAHAPCAAVIHDWQFSRQRTISIDAPIDTFCDKIAVLEKTGGFVINGNVGEAATTEASLDKRWIDTAIIGERCDERGVHAVSWSDPVRVGNLDIKSRVSFTTYLIPYPRGNKRSPAGVPSISCFTSLKDSWA